MADEFVENPRKMSVTRPDVFESRHFISVDELENYERRVAALSGSAQAMTGLGLELSEAAVAYGKLWTPEKGSSVISKD